MQKLSCFKAYDVRGRVPEELNEDLAYRIGRAYATFLSPARVAVGRDIRFSSLPLTEALSAGLNDSQGGGLGPGAVRHGADLLRHLSPGAGRRHYGHRQPQPPGIQRHEVRPGRVPAPERRLRASRRSNAWPRPGNSRPPPGREGGRRATDCLEAYIAHLLSYIDPQVMKPLKVVVNAGNGCAGPVLDALEKHLPFQLIKIHHDPDPTFPHGVPNPLLPENRDVTAQAVRDHGAAVGLAWDGDFDRCFFFDEQGTFIEGYYLVGFIAAASWRGSRGRPSFMTPG